MNYTEFIEKLKQAAHEQLDYRPDKMQFYQKGFNADYGNYENEHLVGSWCGSIASVEITKEPKDELGYEEYHPDFR